ncbi:MAG: TRAP transporter small permease [Betaproteobacteria bacterium]|nr:TRAP transporter small permease [Betaproteobacteria bacterium]
MRVASLLLLAAVVITPLAQITMRGVFNLPMAGAEEMTRYFMIALAFLAASYVTQQGGQIRMEEFQIFLPPRPRWVLQLMVELAGVVVFGIFFVASLVTISRNMNSVTPVMEMPFWLFMAPLTVGSLLLVLETGVTLAHTWHNRRPDEKHTVLT